MTRLLLAAACPLLVLAAPPTAPVPKGRLRDAPLHCPTAVGTERVYKHAHDEVVEVVTAAHEKGGAQVVSVDWLCEGKKVGCEKLSASPEGVLRLELNEVALDPPWCVLQTGRKPGGRWEADYTGTVFQFRASYTARDSEVIQVPAGRYRCLVVERADHDRNGGRTSLAWFAPGVGMVKEVVKTDSGEWATSKVLKSFTPGKQ